MGIEENQRNDKNTAFISYGHHNPVIFRFLQGVGYIYVFLKVICVYCCLKSSDFGIIYIYFSTILLVMLVQIVTVKPTIFKKQFHDFPKKLLLKLQMVSQKQKLNCARRPFFFCVRLSLDPEGRLKGRGWVKSRKDFIKQIPLKMNRYKKS